MAEITATSDDHWTISDAVNDKVQVPNKGQPVDVESDIDNATGVVQSWWTKETGLDYPDDLPDPTTVADDGENELLGSATAYLAASLVHERFTDNVRSSQGGEEGGERESRYVFLENRAHQVFDAWLSLNGYDSATGPDDDPEYVGTPDIGVGQIDSLVDLP